MLSVNFGYPEILLNCRLLYYVGFHLISATNVCIVTSSDCIVIVDG